MRYPPRILTAMLLMACSSEPGANDDDASSPATSSSQTSGATDSTTSGSTTSGSAPVDTGAASTGVSTAGSTDSNGVVAAGVADDAATASTSDAVEQPMTGAADAPSAGDPETTTTGEMVVDDAPGADDAVAMSEDDTSDADDPDAMEEPAAEDDVMADSTMDDAAMADDAVDDTGESTADDATEPSASSESAGCAAPTVSSGDTNITLDVGGTMRSFILHVPPGYTGDSPTPFVIDFHPLGGSGSQEQQGSGYQSVADREGFPIAFPDGIDNAWNVGPCCTNSRDVDDVGFALAIVDSVAADACIDLSRVYSVGFSMGGGMSHHLACNAADTFAAVAPAAFDLLIPEEQPCNPSRPISSLTFRGTTDTTAPFNGGPGPSGRANFLGAYDGFAAWQELNGCSDVNTVEGDCTIYTECDDGVEVGLCVAEGGGHTYGDANLGWAFLQRFTLP